MNLPLFVDNAAARAGGLTTGAFYLSPTGAVMITVPNRYFIYTTNTNHTGNLGGRAGADNICNLNAHRPAVCTRGWAFMSMNADDEIRDFPTTLPGRTGMPMALGAPWYSRTGTHAGVRIANDWAGLLSGTILNRIDAGGGASRYWTHSHATGEVWHNACHGSTSVAGTGWAGIGRGEFSNPSWLLHETGSCGMNISVLCACF